MKAAELRKSILQAAVEGKLVPQDPNDEPASELLKRIKQEKERLIRDGKIKKKKSISSIDKDIISFDLPEGWALSCLSEITTFIATGPFGSLLHKSDYIIDGIPLVNPANMKGGKIVPSDKMMISETTRTRMEKYILRTGYIVVARRGDLGRCAVVTENESGWICGTGSFFLQLVSQIYAPYFLLFFQSSVCRTQLNAESVGATMNNLNHAILNKVFVTIPPYDEQQRIVNKVDELMILCDELETAEKELDTLENQFAEYLPKSNLQAAVQGKLVAQDPYDEPATELLKRIKQEKDELIRDGKIKKEKPLPPINEDEIPYDLPNGWQWCRLGDVVIQNIGGGTPSKHNAKYWGGDIPWASVKDLNCDVLQETQDKITKLGLENSSSNLIPAGNIIICTRMGLGKIVTTAIDVAINQDLRALYLAEAHVNKQFFIYSYKAQEVTGSGMTVKGIKVEELHAILFALPPLAEQHRIVAKIDELMNLCDELKTAHNLPLAQKTQSIIPFPQKTVASVATDKDIRMAARGDAKGGLVGQAALDADELLGEE